MKLLMLAPASHYEEGWFGKQLTALAASAAGVAAEEGWDVTELGLQDCSDHDWHAALAGTDAVVLLGGHDVDPRHYAGPTDYPGSGNHLGLADQRSLAVVQACHADRIPLLGICRGLHLINVAFGGTLDPHLTNSDLHRVADGQGRMVSHEIELAADTALAQALGVDGALVESSHHQGVRTLGDGLRASAWASHDGLIEGLEHPGRPIIAVQWHPEAPGSEPGQLASLLGWLGAGVPMAQAG